MLGALRKDLTNKTRLPASEVPTLIKELSKALCAHPRYDTRTVAEVLELADPPPDPVERDGDDDEEGEDEEGEREGEGAYRPRRITMGDEGLDLLLGGGIALGEVTEIAGQS